MRISKTNFTGFVDYCYSKQISFFRSRFFFFLVYNKTSSYTRYFTMSKHLVFLLTVSIENATVVLITVKTFSAAKTGRQTFTAVHECTISKQDDLRSAEPMEIDFENTCGNRWIFCSELQNAIGLDRVATPNMRRQLPRSWYIRIRETRT